MFGLEIATLLLGISFIAAGMIQSRKTGQKKWRILMIIGIIPVLVSVFLLVCTFWLLYGIQVQEPGEVQQKTERSLRKTQMQSQNQVPVQIPTSLAATGALTGLIPKTCTWMIQALSFSAFPH